MSDVMQLVTERIIKSLESGVVPWRKPWISPNRGAFNRVSGKKYSFLNQLLLKNEGEYASYNQWLSLGGHVKKGERAEMVVFWKFPEEKESEDDSKEEEVSEEEEVFLQKRKKPIPILKFHYVFHVSQVEGISPLEKEMIKFNHEPIEKIYNILNEYIQRENISLDIGAYSEAYYSPSIDLIHIPELGLYKNPEEYYSTFAHEAVHSTGAANRLNREGVINIKFGSNTYSCEELVAEIGAASILSILGSETDSSYQNSVAYINNWLQALKSDKKMLIVAAGQAEKAINFIFGN